MTHPTEKLTIVGGGVIAALRAYYAWQTAKAKGRDIRITIYEKNQTVRATTAARIAASLTPDEILSVVPSGDALRRALSVKFDQPGGIMVDDVPGVNDVVAAKTFVDAVEAYSKDATANSQHQSVLLKLGKLSMALWAKIYENADSELQHIFDESNFKPCREVDQNETALGNGYRIDLIYNMDGAKEHAKGMVSTYQSLSYGNCHLLSPQQVLARDPSLADFVARQTEDVSGTKQWKSDVCAVWRPGGCLDLDYFLPRFYEYLGKKMGVYLNESGKTKPCFRVKYGRNVVGTKLSKPNDEQTKTINGLTIEDAATNLTQAKKNKFTYEHSSYLFCPGTNVGTLHQLGFKEPSYANFAGPSLALKIPLDPKDETFATLDHCMEVHSVGVVLAWQARVINENGVNYLSIKVGGTKAFYGPKRPKLDDEFAIDRNVLQLRAIFDVLPQAIIKAMALVDSQVTQELTFAHLQTLVRHGLAKRWVGTRAVAFDGFPTVGPLYKSDGHRVENAATITHAGSGGVSFAPGLVHCLNRFALLGHPSTHSNADDEDPLAKEVRSLGTSHRVAPGLKT